MTPFPLLVKFRNAITPLLRVWQTCARLRNKPKHSISVIQPSRVGCATSARKACRVFSRNALLARTLQARARHRAVALFQMLRAKSRRPRISACDPKRLLASFVAPYGESAMRTFLLLAARRVSETRGLSQATRPARFAAGNCAASSTRLDRNPHHRIAARLTQNCPQMAAPRPPAVSHT